MSIRPVQTKADDEKLDVILEDKTEAKKAASSGAAAHAAADDKIKVSITRLDNLINMTGRAGDRATDGRRGDPHGNLSTHDLARKVAHQGKIVESFRNSRCPCVWCRSMGVFQKMSRLARDLSRKGDKQVDFVTVGEETELDRTVVDKIADPLIHMVRNFARSRHRASADRCQGRQERHRASGAAGLPSGRNIVIESKTMEKGWTRIASSEGPSKPASWNRARSFRRRDLQAHLPPRTLDGGEDHERLGTRRRHGRREEEHRISARQDRNQLGSRQGQTFTIRLSPCPTGGHRRHVVSIGDQRYNHSINAIVRSLRPTSRQISSVQGRGEMILERGELIPLVRLYRLLGAVATEEDPTKALVVVVEEDGKKCCLLVDDLLAQQQVVIKSLGDALGRVRGVSGGAIMGDGKVCLILDIPGLVALAQAQ